MKLFSSLLLVVAIATINNVVIVVDADVLLVPTDLPTDFPTDNPTDNPTPYPTTNPTTSKAPTPTPTKEPTLTPTASLSPTKSPEPTRFSIPDAPTCPNEDNGEPYYPKASRDYWSRSYWGYSFKVSKYCEYRMYHPETGSKYYNTVLKFITAAAEVQGGWYLESSGSGTLSGQLPSSAEDDIEVTSNCDGMGTKTCIELKTTSAATSGGAVKFVFHVEDNAFKFKSFLDNFVKYGGSSWVTSNTKMCGKKPFCWDGNGGGGRGWHYGRCYVSRTVTSGHCGQYDFLIDGDLSLLPTPTFYERCGDPWKWFQACIATWDCDYIDEGGEFAYGRPSRHAYKWKNNWYFKLSGNGILHNSMKWMCGAGWEGENKAKAIKDFADYLYYTNLFSENEESCDAIAPTPAPTSSQQPSSSVQPTAMKAPDCSDMETIDGVKFEGEKPTRTWDHFKKDYWTINNGKKRFQIDENCAFNYRDTNWKNKVDFGIDIVRWIDTFGSMVYNTVRVDNGSELIPETPTWGQVSYYECGTGKWCTKIAAGKGVTGDYIWETDTSSRAKGMRDWLRGRIGSDPEIFLTKADGSLTCGTMPYCYDDKTHTTCHIDFNSENCGTYDFVVKGDDRYVEGGYFRTGDVMEFFETCTNSMGCTLTNAGSSEFQYHNSINRYAYWEGKIDSWAFKLSGSKAFKKGDKNMLWKCPTYEAANEMKEFATALYTQNLWWDNFKCTEPPTSGPTPAITDSPTKSPTEVPSQAPTECVDSLLSREPLNIAVVVDMSYSTYKYTFDGTPIGDVNKDGKPNTILDAEIQATIELLKVIDEDENLNNGNTNIGLVVFDTEAKYVGSFNPLDASNSGPNQDLIDVLTSLETHKKDVDVAVSNTGFTNFDDALDKTIDYFIEGAVNPDDRTNIMVFLSDGVPNVRGDGDNENWCTNTTGVDCSLAPGPDPTMDWSDKPWEEGELSYCKREDTTCYNNEYMGCALGIYTCQNTEPAMSYESELAKLKEWGVYNLAIGVGAGSEVHEGSALFLIDSNPNKENGILPYQVFTTDDLSTALKNLCIENTDPPTVTPSSSPSGVPTKSPAPSLGPTGTPTSGPTGAPTKTATPAPTGAPNVAPTAGPTGSPVDTPSVSPTMAPTICAYTEVDFNTPEGKSSIDAVNWKENGFRVDSDGLNDLTFTSYGGDVGDALALTPKPDDGSGSTPDNEIIFTLDGTFENSMKIVLYDVDSTPGSCSPVVRTQLPGGATGTSTDIQSLGTSSEQTLEIPVEGVWRVIVDLCGSGAITEVGVCRDPSATPAPVGLSPPSETNEPTPSPNTYTRAPTSCPEDVKLLDTVGVASYDSLPITVIERTKESVKFVVTNEWTETLDYIYVQYYDLNRNEPCVQREQVITTYAEEFEALCMAHTPVTVVSIWVSDDSLNAETDVAEIPRCCHGPEDDTNPKVQLTFEVLCYCPEDEAAEA